MANRPGTSAPSVTNGPVRMGVPIQVGTKVPIPPAMRVVRAKTERSVTMTSREVPLIHPKDADSKQIQQVLVPRVKVFDLSDPGQVEDLEGVLQRVSLKEAILSEMKAHFDEVRGRFLQYVRWSEVTHALPGQVAAAVQAVRQETASVPPAG